LEDSCEHDNEPSGSMKCWVILVTVAMLPAKNTEFPSVDLDYLQGGSSSVPDVTGSGTISFLLVVIEMAYDTQLPERQWRDY
jgi:hypothetical protein